MKTVLFRTLSIQQEVHIKPHELGGWVAEFGNFMDPITGKPVDQDPELIAECEAMDAHMKSQGYVEPEEPRWDGEESAEKWVKLLAAQQSTNEDLHAFNAPCECYKDAYKSLDIDMRDHWEAHCLNRATADYI